ncbi:MAG: hypothetical protein V3T99_05435 [Nitrososphaerales archaeon]
MSGGEYWRSPTWGMRKWICTKNTRAWIAAISKTLREFSTSGLVKQSAKFLSVGKCSMIGDYGIVLYINKNGELFGQKTIKDNRFDY